MNGDGEPGFRPTAIPQDTIHVILQYLSESLLLPSHLISRPLLQRHHFLQLTTDDYISYLSWPGHSTELLSTAISSLPSPATDQCALYPIAYSSDTEAVLAHVSVTASDAKLGSHVRLVFLWDSEIAEWKYHNLALMPFPSESVSTVDQLTMSFEHSDIDAATYWGNSQDLDKINSHGPEEPHLSTSEDDYWARYSTVQVGPSDFDSSLSPSRRQAAGESDRVMVAYSTTQTEVYDPLEPPSPEQLARRLAALPSQSHLSSPSISDVPSRSVTDSPTLSPDQAYPLDLGLMTNATDAKTTLVFADKHPSDAFLKDAIRSLYRLWMESRSGANQDAFIDIVRQSICG